MDPVTSAAALSHPEEMKASVSLRLGPAHLAASARTTPAGLVATGFLVSAILLSLGRLVRAVRAASRDAG